MFKKSKVFLAIAITLVMCLSSALPALAKGPVIGSEENPAKAVINKTLQVPGDTTVPTVTFTFDVTKVSINNRAEDYPGEIPDLSNISQGLSFSDADTSKVEGVITSIIKKTGDIFESVAWGHAGIYVYKITETPDVYNIADPNHESMTYSAAEYTLTVYVKNTVDGTGVYVFAYEAVVETADNGDQEVGKKIDAGPGTPTGPSGLLFTNTYIKTNGATDPEDPDPTDPDETTLAVSKTVVGSLGNHERFFKFSMTLTATPLLTTVPGYYRAYVVEDVAGVPTVVTSIDNADASLIGMDAGGSYIKISTDGATAFNLRHGQKLVFVDTPVDTKYNVTELAHLNYLPTMAITHNGSNTNIQGSAINNLLSSGDRYVGNSLEKVDVTNAMDEITPTGLNLNDLPFYGLILLVLGGFITFAVVKFRKRKSDTK